MKTILPLHHLKIRDLNEGVSTEKMDRSQLMCFFSLSHVVGIKSSSQLWLTRDCQSNEPKKESTEHVFLFFQASLLPQTQIPWLNP